MKIYINHPGENWICDRLRKEFYQYNPEICTENIAEADTVWVISPWAFNYNNPILKLKNVISTIHHIVPEKFNEENVFNINKYSNKIHFVSDSTKIFLANYINKPSFTKHWWINNSLFNKLDRDKCLLDLNLKDDKFYVGSFQRDTEGSDLISPKLEKGPDIFCDIVEKEFSKNKNLVVLLAGWRRNYVISRLTKSGIPFEFKEMCSFEDLNKLYNCLDLYIVSSRHEGGPQAIPECAASQTPIISTNVGCAKIFLNEKSIFNIGEHERAKPDVNFAYKKSLDYFINKKGFDKFLYEIHNSYS
jgi:glycosyltransferase involved in cell wall biosynthesis